MNTRNQGLWRRFISVAKPYWVSNEKFSALGLLAMLLLLLGAVNGLNIVINYVAGDFQTALVKKEVDEFYRLLYIYGSIFVIGTPIVVMYGYVRDRLGMSWRRWLTNHLLEKYFKNRAYYKLGDMKEIDNPDERLSMDIDSFTASALRLLLAVLGSIITFFSFIFILWQISTFLVTVLIIYATVGTAVTIWFGKRLVGLNFNQLRKEADYRYGLIHARNNTESIALYRGETRELTGIRRRFADVIKNFNALIGWQRNLGFITVGYDYFVVIIPTLVIAPMYFAGDIEFGTISRAGMAFSQVLGAVSLIVSEFKAISAFTAVVNRLSGFDAALDVAAAPPPSNKPTIKSEVGPTAFKDVTVMTPDYKRTLVTGLNVEFRPDQPVVVVGPSGTGKTSLLRALAGLWNAGSGTISRPEPHEMFFMPQRPYMTLGTLREQILYPNPDARVSDADLRAVLAAVNLAGLEESFGGFDVELNWVDVLSPGQQQRLAFARLLLARPKHVILDEATSALDVANEQLMYELIKQTGASFASVGHRPSLLKHHHSALVLKGEGAWELVPADQLER